MAEWELPVPVSRPRVGSFGFRYQSGSQEDRLSLGRVWKREEKENCEKKTIRRGQRKGRKKTTAEDEEK
jgi:hypothetical protein